MWTLWDSYGWKIAHVGSNGLLLKFQGLWYGVQVLDVEDLGVGSLGD